jgi:hypothetical protein
VLERRRLQFRARLLEVQRREPALRVGARRDELPDALSADGWRTDGWGQILNLALPDLARFKI